MFLTSYFSQGFHHPDEHYSLIELMNWLKTGIPHPDFGWDVRLHIRSTIQPVIYLVFEKSIDLISIQNPFFKSFVFRLLSYALTLFSLFRFVKSLGIRFLISFGKYLNER